MLGFWISTAAHVLCHFGRVTSLYSMPQFPQVGLTSLTLSELTVTSSKDVKYKHIIREVGGKEVGAAPTGWKIYFGKLLRSGVQAAQGSRTGQLALC